MDSSTCQRPSVLSKLRSDTLEYGSLYEHYRTAQWSNFECLEGYLTVANGEVKKCAADGPGGPTDNNFLGCGSFRREEKFIMKKASLKNYQKKHFVKMKCV